MLGSASAAFAPLLGPDEHLIWSGKPRGGIRFDLSDIFVIPFSLVWAGLAFTGFFSTWRTEAPLLSRLVSLLFAAVGIYMVAGRFVFAALMRQNTYYALTDQRVMILTTLFSRRLQSVDMASLGPVTIDVGGSGVGTIAFGGDVDTTPISSFFARGFGTNNRNAPPSFEALDDAQSVYALIRQTQRLRLDPGSPLAEVSVN